MWRTSQQTEERLSCQFNVVQDAAEEPWWDVLAFMDWHDGGATVGMAQVEMAALLTDALKSKTLQETD